jgi:hypothetical protein
MLSACRLANLSARAHYADLVVLTQAAGRLGRRGAADRRQGRALHLA